MPDRRREDRIEVPDDDDTQMQVGRGLMMRAAQERVGAKERTLMKILISAAGLLVATSISGIFVMHADSARQAQALMDLSKIVDDNRQQEQHRIDRLEDMFAQFLKRDSVRQ